MMKGAAIQPREAVRELREVLDVVEEPCPETERIVSAEELQTLAADPLITIGAHTVSHPILATLTLEAAEAEIDQSRRDLELLTGRAPDLFSYPHGRRGNYTPQVADYLRATGWQAAVTTEPGMGTPGSDLMQLPRLPLGLGPPARLAWGLARTAREAR